MRELDEIIKYKEISAYLRERLDVINRIDASGEYYSTVDSREKFKKAYASYLTQSEWKILTLLNGVFPEEAVTKEEPKKEGNVIEFPTKQ